MELADVINKIRKLTAKTVERGCTEFEALAAAAKVGELLQVYNLSLDKVFLEQQTCVQGFVNLTTSNRNSIDGCVPAIASMTDCKVWFHKNYSSPSQYIFFGMDTDVEMAKYLYANIKQAVDVETTIFKSSKEYAEENQGIHGKHLTASFQRGMVARIRYRLQEMTALRQKQEHPPMQSEVNPETLNSTSIVLIKHKKVESEYEKLGLHLTHYYYQKGEVHDLAYDKGRSAGAKVNLSRPIGYKPMGSLQ